MSNGVAAVCPTNYGDRTAASVEHMCEQSPGLSTDVDKWSRGIDPLDVIGLGCSEWLAGPSTEVAGVVDCS